MTCKYARSKYNYTPNDFDLTFNYMDIPVNIKIENASNLSKRLQSVMPLTKVVHLNLNTNNHNEKHYLNVHAVVQLTHKGRLIEVNLK